LWKLMFLSRVALVHCWFPLGESSKLTKLYNAVQRCLSCQGYESPTDSWQSSVRPISYWRCSTALTEQYQGNIEMKDKRSRPRNWICDAESPSSTGEVVLEVVVHKTKSEDHCMHKSEDKEEEPPGPLVDHPSVVLFPDGQVARCLSADLP